LASTARSFFCAYFISLVAMTKQRRWIKQHIFSEQAFKFHDKNMNKLCEELNKSYSSYPSPLLSPPSSSAALTIAENALSAQLLQLRGINPTP